MAGAGFHVEFMFGTVRFYPQFFVKTVEGAVGFAVQKGKGIGIG
jgi:hypothetical protein